MRYGWFRIRFTNRAHIKVLCAFSDTIENWLRLYIKWWIVPVLCLIHVFSEVDYVFLLSCWIPYSTYRHTLQLPYISIEIICLIYAFSCTHILYALLKWHLPQFLFCSLLFSSPVFLFNVSHDDAVANQRF